MVFATSSTCSGLFNKRTYYEEQWMCCTSSFVTRGLCVFLYLVHSTNGQLNPFVAVQLHQRDACCTLRRYFGPWRPLWDKGTLVPMSLGFPVLALLLGPLSVILLVQVHVDPDQGTKARKRDGILMLLLLSIPSSQPEFPFSALFLLYSRS